MTDEPFALSPRRKSRPVHVGHVQVGGDADVVVQTMTNTDTADAKATIEQIARLAVYAEKHFKSRPRGAWLAERVQASTPVAVRL